MKERLSGRRTALKCWACGADIERVTSQCPKCASPLETGTSQQVEALGRVMTSPGQTGYKPSASAAIVASVAFLGLIGVCAGICSNGFGLGSDSSSKSRIPTRQEQIEEHFSAWDGSHKGLTTYVRRFMNDPASFDHDETRYSDNGDHLLINMTFRGKNAFGGVVRNTVTAKVDLNGNVLEILSQGP